MILTANFNPLSDTKLLCTCGHKGCDQRSVNQKTLNMLQDVRWHIKRPMVITSGGRCPNHPNEVNRAIPADHQKQQGVDVAIVGGLERGEIVSNGIAAGFNAIGVAKTFIHLGYRPELPEGKVIMWTY